MNNLDLSTISGLSSTAAREIRLQYMDNANKNNSGNESKWESSPVVGKLIYNTGGINRVSAWSAAYNEGNNSIDLTWTRPDNNPDVEIWVDEVLVKTETSAAASFSITNVPHIAVSGVRAGQAVSNVVGYSVKLIAAYPNGRAQAASFKIWNIPEMTAGTTTENPAIYRNQHGCST